MVDRPGNSSTPNAPSVSSRGRPGTAVRARGRGRAESLLDAAGAVLIEEGYAALSIRRIAARAGVRPGHLQYYYPAKADVVRALLERQLARAIADVEEAAGANAGAEADASSLPRDDASSCERGAARDRAGSPSSEHAGAGGDRLDQMVTGLLRRQERAETCRLFLELRALAARDPEVAAAAQQFHTRYWRAVVGVLLAVSPALGRPRAERRAALVVALLEGVMLFRSPGDPRRLPLLGLERELRVLIARLASET